MMLPERYQGEHDDLRFEYGRVAQDDELAELRQEAGCAEDCPDDCDCVQLMLEARQESRDLERDYYTSR